MKKFLRVLLVLVLLIVIVVVVAGLMAPKETNISVSQTINAPKEAVWEQAMKFKNWGNWSYWHKSDTAQTVTYAGTDGEAGSSYSWKGKETGEGTMTNKAMAGNTMTYELKFVKPFEATSGGTITVEDAGNGATKVTWTFHGTNDNFIMGAMGYMMGMEKTLTSQFQEGLNNMKTYVEAHKGEMTAAPAGNISVQETQFAAHTYAGVRKVIKVADWEKEFVSAVELVTKGAGGRINGAPVSIIYNWDPAKGEADAFNGFPIGDNKPVPGATLVEVPASRAYMVVHTGNPSGTEPVHKAIEAHMTGKNETPALKIEEYVRTAPEEKDVNKFVTNVYYLVK